MRKNNSIKVHIFCVMLVILTGITYAKDNIEIDSLNSCLKEYNAREVKEIDNWSEMIQYVYTAITNYEGAVVLYTGQDYEELSMESVDELFKVTMQIDDLNSLSDAAALWGNMESYNKGLAQTDEGALVCLSIKYKHTKSQMEQVNQEIEAIIKELEIKWDIKNIPLEQRVKIIHDYLGTHFDYDESFSNYTDYDGFFNRIDDKQVMVCQGYSLLAYKLLNMCNVPTNILVSDTHSWNIVELDGAWYHLDITNDDLGIYDQPINYKYYLKSKLKGTSYQYLESSFFYENISEEINFGKTDYKQIFGYELFIDKSNIQVMKYKLSSYMPYIIIVIGLIAIYSVVLGVIHQWYKRKKAKSKKLFDLFNSI